MWDLLLHNAEIATLAGDPHNYGLVSDGSLAIEGGRIAWVGAAPELPAGSARETVDLGGTLVTPGLIDCHTHLVFAGDRSAEFEQRLAGASYAEIARGGGGILATVRATRVASEEALLELTARRLDRLQAEGITTVEIKSGYGLDLATELKMLRVARRLALNRSDIDIFTTFLGAHAIPPEYRDHRESYVELVAGPMLEAVIEEGLASAVDAFCEAIAFTPAEIERIFAATRNRGLALKLHADQLEDSGGAELAARFGALSADHLEHASEAGVRAMAAAGTAAVLLPGACYTLRQAARPPVGLFRTLGIPMAVATDANPGSSPLLSPLLAMNMACTLFGLTSAEALRGMTANAAKALGLEDRGVLATGMRADIAIWDVKRPAELSYWLGAAPLIGLVKDGRFVRRPPARP